MSDGWYEITDDDGDHYVCAPGAKPGEHHCYYIGNLEDTCGTCHYYARLFVHAEAMKEVLEQVATRTQETLEIMRREGFVVDNLADRWQKLVFTLHTMLASDAQKAQDLVEAVGQDPSQGETSVEDLNL